MGKLLTVNGIELPPPAPGMEIVTSWTVDAARNANNAVVGQLVGRKLWKINNLQWNGISIAKWKLIKDAIEPFYVPVEFLDDVNEYHNIYMYPGDATGKPYTAKDGLYSFIQNGKFNLIDLGW